MRYRILATLKVEIFFDTDTDKESGHFEDEVDDVTNIALKVLDSADKDISVVDFNADDPELVTG